MKRLFDFTAALLALLLLCLPLLALTLLVAAKLGRPAFFRQVRPGLHGHPFEMVKFRAMTDAGHASRPCNCCKPTPCIRPCGCMRSVGV